MATISFVRFDAQFQCRRIYVFEKASMYVTVPGFWARLPRCWKCSAVKCPLTGCGTEQTSRSLWC